MDGGRARNYAISAEKENMRFVISRSGFESLNRHRDRDACRGFMPAPDLQTEPRGNQARTTVTEHFACRTMLAVFGPSR